MNHPTFLPICLPLIFYVTITIASAWIYCGDDAVCPDGNTCCLNSGRCISNDMGSSNATCCSDDHTGCPLGYICHENEILAANHNCLATDEAPMADEFVQILPRYHLCHVSHEMSQLHGLNISSENSSEPNLNISNNGAGKDFENELKLAYYSSHGPIERVSSPEYIDMILIVIHGSGRNADDYFCSALAASEIQQTWNNVWVIAPRFLEDVDDPPSNEYLFWDHADGDGTWRYGANSVNGGLKRSRTSGISSFAALDQLVNQLWVIAPGLKQIVIAGHSSGGQFVNRWSLLTQQQKGHPKQTAKEAQSWMDNNYDKIKWVVANPSSYVYVTPLRWMGDQRKWDVPVDAPPLPLSSQRNLEDCPNYNKWEWGLENGGIYDVSYRKNVFQNNDVSSIIEEFRKRNVIYMTGGLDQCPEGSDKNANNIYYGEGERINVSCHSHGLETSCMDELQGRTRLERSFRYMRSLKDVMGGEDLWKNHTHVIVSGVGHDHSLMWTSSVGIEAMFGTIKTSGYGESQENIRAGKLRTRSSNNRGSIERVNV